MNERVERLRQLSLDAKPTISAERAQLLTKFYKENEAKYSVPVTAGHGFQISVRAQDDLHRRRRAHRRRARPPPSVTPTFPELTCHSAEDLEILDTREKTSYSVPPEAIKVYKDEVIPYWRGRSIRDRVFPLLPKEWHDAYEAGIYTEFMEQRAPGHTVADGKLYRKGLVEFKVEIAEAKEALDYINDPEAFQKREQLEAMSIAADAAIIFAKRHAKRAREMAGEEKDPKRKAELERIAATLRACSRSRASRFLGSTPGLLVLPPRCDHRAERLGLLQSGTPRPPSGTLLRQRDRRGQRSIVRAPRSSSSAGGSSSTTIRRRPKSASRRRRAEPIRISPTSTSAD